VSKFLSQDSQSIFHRLLLYICLIQQAQKAHHYKDPGHLQVTTTTSLKGLYFRSIKERKA